MNHAVSLDTIKARITMMRETSSGGPLELILNPLLSALVDPSIASSSALNGTIVSFVAAEAAPKDWPYEPTVDAACSCLEKIIAAKPNDDANIRQATLPIIDAIANHNSRARERGYNALDIVVEKADRLPNISEVIAAVAQSLATDGTAVTYNSGSAILDKILKKWPNAISAEVLIDCARAGRKSAEADLSQRHAPVRARAFSAS